MSGEFDPEPVTRREIGPLLAERRRSMNDDHIKSHDTINKDGRKIKKEKRPAKGKGGTKTVDIDYTALFVPGASATSSVEILVIEAELAAEEDYSGNPHVPSRDSVLEAAVEKIESMGLVPAWEVVR